MVVFTCNHCGDSLQKPKVEKHYQFACKNPVFLTCVDCLKDFRGDEFDAHTKCFTEDERYAAKGTEVGLPKKGEAKQESWVDMIRSILKEEPRMKPPHRNMLNKIACFNNVPRKKPKFINFIKSSFGGRANVTDIEAVWDMIEMYKASFFSKKATDEKNNSAVKDENQTEADENISNEKQKKKKKNKEESISHEQTLIGDAVNGNTVAANSKSKRKSKENASSDEKLKEDSVENGNIDNAKKSKKKKKSENPSADAESVQANGTTENKPEAGVDDDADHVSKQNGDQDVSQTIKNSKLEKKSKRKTSVQAEGNTGEPVEKKIKYETTEIENQNESINNTKFDFKAKIVEILLAKTSINPGKLQKKIKKMYLMETGEEFSEKVLKKYNKKLKQIENIDITEDSVKILDTVK